MVIQLRNFWQNIFGQTRNRDVIAAPVPEQPRQVEAPLLDIAPNDPLLAYVLSTPGPIEVEKLTLDSPAVEVLRQAEVELTIPLVSQGELIGLINLGPRLSEQAYSGDDRRLLSNLATQAAPAVRVAQLVRQQQTEIKERDRMRRRGPST